jgi:hypothetical protein
MSVYTRIKLRRNTASNWTTNNPTLLAGEVGIDTTNNKIKIGTGSATWTSLPYATLTPTEINALITGLQGQIDSLASNLNNTLDDYVPIGDVGQADGVASLDSNGKIPDSQIPSTITRDSELSAHENDTTNIHGIADTSALATKTYADNAASTAAAAIVNSAPAALDTLNELAAALNNDSSFSSTITTSLSGKAPIASPTFTGTITLPLSTAGYVKTNSSGVISSSSSISQSDVSNLITDLGLKAPLASPALTGVPTAPTAAAGTNTTQIATTAYVQDSLAMAMALAL